MTLFCLLNLSASFTSVISFPILAFGLQPSAGCIVMLLDNSAGTGHTFCGGISCEVSICSTNKMVHFLLCPVLPCFVFLHCHLFPSGFRGFRKPLALSKCHMQAMFATIQFISRCMWCIYPFHLRMEAQTVIVIPLGSSGYLLLMIIVYSGAMHTYYLFSRHL